MNREDRIKQRAHEIWESEGRPNGMHDQHWSRAQQEVSDDDVTASSSGEASGLASSLQPGGTTPGMSPGAGMGSLGTGGGSTAGRGSGSVRR